MGVEDFFNKAMFLCEKLWLFGLFSGDKDDYIGVWMMKIMIKQNKLI